jgi:hypothetical protein
MCIPLGLIALGLGAVSTGVAIKQSKDAKKDREALAARQKANALETKSEADGELRGERKKDYGNRSRSRSEYSAQQPGVFTPRSFFSAG